MKKIFQMSFLLVLVGFLTSACQLLAPASDPSMDQTMIALAIQQTSLAIQQQGGGQAPPPVSVPDTPAQPTYTPYPTFTESQPEPPPPPEQPTQAPPTPTPTATPTDVVPPASDKLFLNVTTDRSVFYCVSSNGPTTLTITVEMSDVDRGATLFWRLEQKSNYNTTDWEVVDMRRAGGNTRAYTFDANVWAGTNNFYYPPLMGESWFEYQIVSNDGAERTGVFVNVTFFPCAQ